MTTGRYQPPSKTELSQSIAELDQKYTGNEPKRFTLIYLIQELQNQLDSGSADKIKLGAMSFGRELIKTEYSVRSPKEKTIFGMIKIGSNLDKVLEKGLKIDRNNPLDDIQSFIYMVELYDYLQAHPNLCQYLIDSLQLKSDKEHCKKPCKIIWKTSEELIKNILSIVSNILYHHSEGLTEILKINLSTDFLRRKIKSIVENYWEKANKEKRSEKHELYADLMEFVNRTADIYGEPDNKKFPLEYAKQFSQPYNLRIAVILFVMAVIESKEYYYSGWVFWGPEKSELYQDCQKALEALNIKRTYYMNPSEKCDYLDSLLNHLKPKKFAALKSTDLYKAAEPLSDNSAVKPANPSKTNKQLFDKIGNQLEFINQQLADQLRALLTMKDPSPSVSARVGSNVGYVTEYGFNTGVNWVVSTVFIPDIGKQAIRTASGAVGFMLFGPTGAFIGMCLGHHVANTLLPGTISAACISAVEPVGRTLGSISGGIVSVAIYPVEQGFKYAFSSDLVLRKKQEEYIARNQEFISALFKLPPKVFSDDKKELLQSAAKLAL